MRVWLNGAVVPTGQARVPVTDHGFSVGDGVFETMRVVHGRPFAQTRHIARLRRSARLLGLAVPDADLVAQAIKETVDANRAELGGIGRLRVTYTSGDGPPGSERGTGPCTLVVQVTPNGTQSDALHAVTLPWPRNERGPLAGVKSTSFAEGAVALAAARRMGASEAILPNTRGELCEGATSNVFVVHGGRARTPPLASGCLPGVTRALVLEWFDVFEETLQLAELSSAEEVFITSSSRGVQAVHQLDGRTMGATPVSDDLSRQFAMRATWDFDP